MGTEGIALAILLIWSACGLLCVWWWETRGRFR